MKNITKLAAAIALASSMTAPAMAEVSLSATGGFVSDYYFRGVNLGDAGAHASVDVESEGFYAGVWAIDDGGSAGGNDGLEVDFYAGYGMEMENGLSLGLGYTGYEYTYSPASEQEVMLSAGFMGFGADFAVGTADDGAGVKDDYTFTTVNWSGEVFSALYGFKQFDETNNKSEYSYVELAASGEVSGLDVGLTLGKTTGVKDAAGMNTASGNGYMFINVTKSFDL